MKNQFFKYGYITGLLCAIIIGVVCFNLFLKPPEINIKDISLIDLNNKPLSSDYFLNKPLVVNFWGTWCAPCVKELPMFVNLKKKYKGKVNFVFVSDEELIKIKNFESRKKFDINYAKSVESFNSFGLNSRPATYFFNENGILVDKIIGEINEPELIKHLNKL